MARFGDLIPLLDPYRIGTNADRVATVVQPRRTDLSATSRRPGLSVVVLNKDHGDLVEQVFQGWDAVREELVGAGVEAELLVGDTGSVDPSAVALLRDPPPGCRVEWDMTYHFSRCNNDLFARAAYDTVLFMNNDVLIRDQPLAVPRAFELMRSRREIGALGAVLFFADGSLQHGGVDFFARPDLYGFCHHPGTRQGIAVSEGDVFDVPAATGAFLMVRSGAFAALGGFDERYAVECQDVDLCLRLHRLGLGTKVAHLGDLVHLENGTRTVGEEQWDDRSLFVRRWSSYVEAM